MTTRTTAGQRVFWADDEDDAARSDDTVSRLGAHVRDRADRFADDWADEAGQVITDPVRFAVAAWVVATPPVMSSTLLPAPTNDRLSPTVDQFSRSGQPRFGLLPHGLPQEQEPVDIATTSRCSSYTQPPPAGSRSAWWIAPVSGWPCRVCPGCRCGARCWPGPVGARSPGSRPGCLPQV